MLATIRNTKAIRSAKIMLLCAFAGALASCATKQEPQLITDNGGRESTLPWNKQEKWEQAGNLGGLAERAQRR